MNTSSEEEAEDMEELDDSFDRRLATSLEVARLAWLGKATGTGLRVARTFSYPDGVVRRCVRNWEVSDAENLEKDVDGI